MKIKSLFLMLALGALSASNIASAETVTFLGLYDGNDGTYNGVVGRADGSDWLSDIIGEELSEGTRLDWNFGPTLDNPDADPFTNPQSYGGLTIKGTTFKEGSDSTEITAGTWTYESSTVPLDYLTLKFDGFFALYSITGYNLTDPAEVLGPITWNVADYIGMDVFETVKTDGILSSTGNIAGVFGDDAYHNGRTNFALSHGAGYEVVPVPAAVWLFGSGLLGLVGIARRRSA